MTDIKNLTLLKENPAPNGQPTLPARDFMHFSPMVGGKILKKYIFLAVKDIAFKVGATMGASGRTSGTLIYDESGTPVFITTKDGSNTLDSIKSSCMKNSIVLDYLGNEIPSAIYAAVATAFHSVATQTEKRAGDGTTATTVIAAQFMLSAIAQADLDPSSFCRKIDVISASIAERIYKHATKDGDITEQMLISIATTSLNHDVELGKKLGAVIYKAGRYGYCFVEGSKGMYEDRIEMIDGYTFACNNNPLFFNQGGRGIYENPFIIVSKDPIDDIVDAKGQKPSLKPLLEHYQFVCNSIKETRPLIIFAPSVAGAALMLIESNYTKKIAPILCVTFGNFNRGQQEQILEDISKATSAKLFSTEMNCSISKIAQNKEPFGVCSRVFLEKGHFYIESPQHSPDFEHFSNNMYQKMVSLDPDKDELELAWIQRRYASLGSSIIRVTVAANSDAELKERIDSVRDAQLACFSALRKGIVTGGGITLYNLSNDYSDNPVYQQALLAPLMQICSNANINHNDFDLPSHESTYGIDVLTNEVRNFWHPPMILDPAESVVQAFTNACSIVKTFLMLENFNY